MMKRHGVGCASQDADLGVAAEQGQRAKGALPEIGNQQEWSRGGGVGGS